MTQERDDYMRQQEADHDLLRMRDPYKQQFGRAARLVPPADMQHVVHDHGTFTFPLRGNAPTPRERTEKILRDCGADEKLVAAVVPMICGIINEIAALEYHRGERDGISRTRNRPGNGDMGG